jgi:hypothetical protein
MKGYGEEVAVPAFTTNQEDLLSLYGFMRGHGRLQKRDLFARKIDFSRKPSRRPPLSGVCLASRSSCRRKMRAAIPLLRPQAWEPMEAISLGLA